jgi:ABC-2 type transport system permease protein
MKKYLLILKNEFQRHLAYRANIASYSFGHVFEVVAQVIVWTVIFQNAQLIKGYTYDEMITYVVIGWFILFATSNYGFEEKIAKDIHQGTLSNFITKPISYLRYMASVSIGRIVFAFVVVVGIESVLIWLMRAHIILNTQPIVLLLLLAMIAAAYFIRLFFSVIIGLFAFWIVEISGTYFSLNIISKFLSGAYFPMGLLPAAFVRASLFFPFVYTFYIPIQLYLGKIPLRDGLYGLAAELVWLGILYAAIKTVWHYGLKRYEGVGI